MKALHHLVNNAWNCQENGTGMHPFELIFEQGHNCYQFPDGCKFDQFALVGCELWLTNHNQTNYYAEVKLSFTPTFIGWEIQSVKNSHPRKLEDEWFTYTTWKYGKHITTFKFYKCTLLGDLKEKIGKDTAETVTVNLVHGLITPLSKTIILYKKSKLLGQFWNFLFLSSPEFDLISLKNKRTAVEAVVLYGGSHKGHWYRTDNPLQLC
jgi:hypothetical protein